MGVGRFSQDSPGGILHHAVQRDYQYSADPPAGYYVANGSGQLTVPGPEPLLLVFDFLRPLYPVTINETGLPTGAYWSLVVDGAASGSCQAPSGFRVDLLNGTHSYTVYSAGWTPRPANGTVTVQGRAMSVTVTFVPAWRYEVSFESTGLPEPANWSATAGGATSSGDSSVPRCSTC